MSKGTRELGAMFEVGMNTSSKTNYVRFEAGKSVTVIPLIEMEQVIKFSQHEWWDVKPAAFAVCTKRSDCPACRADEGKTKYKGYIPVMMKDGSVSALLAGPMIMNQLIDLCEGEDGVAFKGYQFSIKRIGTGYNTRYTVVPRAPYDGDLSVEFPDILDVVGPADDEAIIEMLIRRGIVEPEFFGRYKAKADKVVENLDDESDEDDNDVGFPDEDDDF